MTVPSLSNFEAKLLGDIVEEADRARHFIGARTVDEFANEEILVYAVKAVVHNVTEACIQIDGGRRGERFAELFPNERLDPLRRMGNSFRHDYGAVNPTILFNDATLTCSRLSRQATELLEAHRRLHGIDPNRLR